MIPRGLGESCTVREHDSALAIAISIDFFELFIHFLFFIFPEPRRYSRSSSWWVLTSSMSCTKMTIRFIPSTGHSPKHRKCSKPGNGSTQRCRIVRPTHNTLKIHLKKWKLASEVDQPLSSQGNNFHLLFLGCQWDGERNPQRCSSSFFVHFAGWHVDGILTDQLLQGWNRIRPHGKQKQPCMINNHLYPLVWLTHGLNFKVIVHGIQYFKVH